MFDSFNARVDGLNPRIEALQSQVDVAMGRQRAFLQSIAIEDGWCEWEDRDTCPSTWCVKREIHVR